MSTLSAWFTGAVASHQPDTVAGVDVERDIGQQGREPTTTDNCCAEIMRVLPQDVEMGWHSLVYWGPKDFTILFTVRFGIGRPSRLR